MYTLYTYVYIYIYIYTYTHINQRSFHRLTEGDEPTSAHHCGGPRPSALQCAIYIYIYIYIYINI